MAARATRSASRKARCTEAVATGPLGALSHDELGVIVDGLADPLQPVVAVALSSTCLGLRTPLRAALEALKERHERAAALCRKLNANHTFRNMSCVEMRESVQLNFFLMKLTTDDVATLAMLLCSGSLPRLHELTFGINGTHNDLGSNLVPILCEGMGRGTAPLLRKLDLSYTSLDPAGAEAFAAALRRGALPMLEMLKVGINPNIGAQGIAALAPQLRKLPYLKELSLVSCELGDDAVASLVDNLGKDDFKALEELIFYRNKLTNKACATLTAAINAGGLPKLVDAPCFLVSINGDEAKGLASVAAVQAVKDALARRSQ